MAMMTVPSTDSSAVKKWSKEVLKETFMKAWWARFMGKSMESPVYLKNDFTKEQGDQVKFDMFPRPAGDPWITDGDYEGNLQKYGKYQETVDLIERGVGCQYRGKLDAQRPAWNTKNINREILTGQAGEMIDAYCFDTMQASDYTKVFRPNQRATDDALVAGDLIDPDTITRAATWAKTGGHRSQPPIKPIMVDGKSCYIFLTYPDVLRDWHRNPEMQQNMREAEVRGAQNPLFRGSEYVLNCGPAKVIVHTHERVHRGTNASSVAISKSVLLGQQALSFAMCEAPRLVEETFQFKTQVGLVYMGIFGAARTSFNSKDWGCVGISTAYTDTNA